MASRHPYRSGNYAPVTVETPLTVCAVEGAVPVELLGGMYVRNGSNPAGPTDAAALNEPAYHWFDGDGCLAGVVFARGVTGQASPTFVQRLVLTDILLASSPTSRTPILPSIATLLGPLSALPALLYSISRAVALSALSRLTAGPVDRISVANTAILWHDGRALATCESGPPMVVRLPGLETQGWWDLEGDGGEIGLRQKAGKLTGWMLEWCTAHPKRDPVTGELVVFHSSLLPPYLHYSVIPSTGTSDEQTTPRILAAPVPIPGSRMMHDLGVSSTHSILLDMPLSLDPLNLLVGKPVVCYSPTTPSRFGIFARHFPGDVLWYEAPSCVIFHTALTFDTPDAVNLLCCRMNSSTLVYAAGNIPLPKSEMLSDGQADTCELYYFRFPLDPPPLAAPSHSFPISKVPFEFPCVPAKLSMSESQFVYGCSLTAGSFSAALGSAAKIDALVKINVKRLITRGMAEGRQHDEAVDSRSVAEILAMQDDRLEIGEQEDDIRVFAMPPGWFAQEMSFVPRRQQRGEDDGFLLTYVFDESQLGAQGVPREGATSELWVIDAYNMREVVAKILLPQRVPYGLHGTWFTEEQIATQRPATSVRSRPDNSLPETVAGPGWRERLRSTLVHAMD